MNLVAVSRVTVFLYTFAHETVEQVHQAAFTPNTKILSLSIS